MAQSDANAIAECIQREGVERMIVVSHRLRTSAGRTVPLCGLSHTAGRHS
jgi:hypothetical protein